MRVVSMSSIVIFSASVIMENVRIDLTTGAAEYPLLDRARGRIVNFLCYFSNFFGA